MNEERGPRSKRTSGAATFEELYVPDRASWRRWLERHHAHSRGVWLVFDKATHREDRLPHADARAFAALSPSAGKGYLHWVSQAKRQDTRAKRIAEVVRLALAFDTAVEDVAAAARTLLASLRTSAPPRDREVEAAKARERSRARFGGQPS